MTDKMEAAWTDAELETEIEVAKNAEVDEYIKTIDWSDTPADRKTLIIGNIRAYACRKTSPETPINQLITRLAVELGKRSAATAALEAKLAKAEAALEHYADSDALQRLAKAIDNLGAEIERYNMPNRENPTQVNPTQLSKQKELNKQRIKETEEVFDFWKTTFNLNGRTLLTNERKAKIKARLKDYPIERIKNAILGCSTSPHHLGQNDSGTRYIDIELICRTGAKMEWFEDMWLSHTHQKLTSQEIDGRTATIASMELNGR